MRVRIQMKFMSRAATPVLFLSSLAFAGTVTIVSPANNSTVSSPVQVKATYSGTATYMKLWVDHVAGTVQQNTSTFSTSVALANGTHLIEVQAQDATTKIVSTTPVTITVGTTSAGKVTVSSPANNSTVTSPVNVNASYSGTASYMKLWVDHVANSTQQNTSTFSTSVALANGAHLLEVQAQDATTKVVSTTPVNITVGTSSAGGVTIVTPANNAIVNSPFLVDATYNGTASYMKLWIDHVSSTVESNTSTFSTNVTLASGTHLLEVQAQDAATKTVFTTPINVTVSTQGGTPSAVYTYMYDNGRTGLNSSETRLTLAAVTNGANFGKLGAWTLDGNIFTQPLYVPNVSINGGAHNVLYVGTENDSVYALNADVPGSVLWKHSFLTSSATIGKGFTGGRTALGSNIGVTGTPVIDPARNWMYVVARTTEGGNQIQRLHAIDITTGAEVLNNALINPVAPGTGAGTDGNGNVPFDALTESQRPALLLEGGVVFVSFASFGDLDPYHGWVIAYDSSSLNFIDAYDVTPNGGGGGFWMSGSGPAGDGNGNVYAATGNGRPDATALFDPPNDLPNSVVKLKVVGGKLTLVDYFAAYNAKCLSADDLDLGSSAPTLIPDVFAGHSILAIGSKEGRAYLLDQNNMGKFHSGSDSQILSSVLFNPTACGQSGFNAASPLRVYGSPAYWNGNIYFGSAFGPLRQYRITNATLVQTALSSHLYPGNGQSGRGPLTIVSSNGNSSGIVWTAENDLNGNGWLRAYDATNVAKALFTSNYGRGSNFVIPMAINGSVYVAGQGILYKYGLLH